jgi:hypothetical protein
LAILPYFQHPISNREYPTPKVRTLSPLPLLGRLNTAEEDGHQLVRFLEKRVNILFYKVTAPYHI